MEERKTYVILGLGRFGSTLAKELTNMNQDVIAIDKDMAEVEKASTYVSNALCLDYRDVDALKAAGVKDADVGVVTTGTQLDQAILGLINLKELGVPKVIVKTIDGRTAELMKKVGADETITPERDMASRLSKKLVSNHILDLFDIDDSYTMFEIAVLPNWIGKSLVDLHLRIDYQLNIIGIKRDNKMIAVIDPHDKLRESDELLIVGPKEVFSKFDELYNIQ